MEDTNIDKKALRVPKCGVGRENATSFAGNVTILPCFLDTQRDITRWRNKESRTAALSSIEGDHAIDGARTCQTRDRL